jgi:hypothetical protein
MLQSTSCVQDECKLSLCRVDCIFGQLFRMRLFVMVKVLNLSAKEIKSQELKYLQVM